MGSFRAKITKPNEIVYEKHKTLAPKQQQPSSSAAPSGFPAQQQEPPSMSSNKPLTLNTVGSQPSSVNNRHSQVPGSQFSPGYQPPTSSFSTQQQPQQSFGGPISPIVPDEPSSSTSRQPSGFHSQQPRDNFNPGPPYPVHPHEQNQEIPTGPAAYPSQQQAGPPSGRLFNSSHADHNPTNNFNLPPIPNTMSGPSNPTSPAPPAATSPAAASPAATSPAAAPPAAAAVTPTPSSPPSKPVFGVSLAELFARDQSAVPMVVYQCILAIDTFGLEVEGIYRLSGTNSHVNALRSAFDNHDTSVTDFRNPANFFHDVNSVANLLKLFFRDLPDPLFTSSGYASFIEASQLEDEGMRRDALHQSINDLPDPNYATLRAVVLHLHRVMQFERVNRMGSPQLGLCLA